MPAKPDQVRTAAGNADASAIRKTLALKLERKKKNASGSHAVAGSGPTGGADTRIGQRSHIATARHDAVARRDEGTDQSPTQIKR